MADEIRFRRQIEEAGYSILYHVLTLDVELSDQAFRLYSLLLKYAQQKDHAWPGIPRLAENLGKSQRSIERAIAELVKKGIISRQRRFGTSTITWIEDLNEVYKDVLERMCESDKNGGTGEHDPDKNGGTVPTKMSCKEEEDKNNKRGEEEEKEPVSSSEKEEKEAAIWQAALSELQLQMTKATFDTWVRDTRLVSCRDDVFIIGAQDEFARSWLENRLLTTVKRILVGIVGKPVEVKFVVEA